MAGTACHLGGIAAGIKPAFVRMVLGKDVLLEDGETHISPEAQMTGKTGLP